jgi:hypothetical protein
MNKAQLAVFEIQKQMYGDREFLSKSKANPFYKSKYTPLNDILTQILPKLHEKDCMMAHTMKPTEFPNQVEVVLIVTHTSGDEWTNSMIMPIEKLNGQEAGKAMTYGRRYSAVPAFELPEYDDDGEGFMKREKKSAKQEPVKPNDDNMFNTISMNAGMDVKAVKAILNKKGYDTAQKVRAKGLDGILTILKGE